MHCVWGVGGGVGGTAWTLSNLIRNVMQFEHQIWHYILKVINLSAWDVGIYAMP